jgi:hypothetical protein
VIIFLVIDGVHMASGGLEIITSFIIYNRFKNNYYSPALVIKPHDRLYWSKTDFNDYKIRVKLVDFENRSKISYELIVDDNGGLVELKKSRYNDNESFIKKLESVNNENH